MIAAPDLRPTPFEVAAGTLFGATPAAVEPARPRDGTPALAALEQSLMRALARPPCVVAFSGGRDSSAVLACAVRAARRGGFEAPIALTLRYPFAPDTDESEWQENVIQHLGVSDWHRREVAPDELDFLGPWATAALRRHGPLYPPNAFSVRLMLAEARGGTLVTGQGGDVLFGPWRWQRAAEIIAGREAPRPRDALRLGLAAAPVRARAAVLRRRQTASFAWLRPDAEKHAQRLAACDQAAEPRRWDTRLPWLLSRRHEAATSWAIERYAHDAGARVAHPLLDAGFVNALGREGGAVGLGGRTEAMRALFGDVLPDTVLRRRGKATFQQVFWGGRARAFVDGWRGEHVDRSLVDTGALRALWAQEYPDIGTAMLLQSAWVASAEDVT